MEGIEKTPKKKNEVAMLDIKKFSIAQLPELKNKKEEIAAVIEANPIVEIIDAETYDQAKKSRTAVKTLRTGTEKEQGNVQREVKTLILDAINTEYNTIITNIKSEEKKRQDIVIAYEAKKEAEKAAKTLAEKQRVDGIKAIMDNYTAEWKTAFNLMVFDTIEEVGATFLESYIEFDSTVLEEFESLFPSVVEDLTQYLSEKSGILTEKENDRLEKLELARVAKEAKERSELQSLRLNELLPFNSFGADVDMATLWSLSETEYKTILDKKKELFAKDKADTEAQQKAQKEADDKAKKEREDFEKEKAAFAEKSAFQTKVDNRINQLTNLGLKFDFQSTFVGFDFFIDVLDIKTFEDEKWDKVITQIENKIATPIVETPEVLAPEVPTVNVCTSVETEKPKSLVDRMIPLVDAYNIAELKQMQSNATWESIEEYFNNSGQKSYSKWLKANYNVPTKL